MTTPTSEASPQAGSTPSCQGFPIPFTIDIFQMPSIDSPVQKPARNRDNANLHSADCGFQSLMPASSRSKSKVDDYPNMDIVERANPKEEYLRKELSVPRLNKIHNSLWFAGRPMPPRPLSYQLATGRLITVSEDIQVHMVWRPGCMFLKPVPRYLLSRQFWEAHLVCSKVRGGQGCQCHREREAANPQDPHRVCEKPELYKCAYGLLLSYTALIQYESDFHIAKYYHLLPEEVEWNTWRKLSWDLLEGSPGNLARVNKRYLFGELRASRLNKIIRFKSFSNAGAGLGGLMRGYHFEFSTYEQQIGVYLAPVAVATVYIALALAAMQVGLATNALKDDFSFNQASYGFTIFAILGPLVVLGGIFILVLVFVVFNYWSTKAYLRSRSKFYGSLGIEPSSNVAPVVVTDQQEGG
ncbi:hypothetical protein ANO14919_113520 [Xylariales sp. No.14919]|nr:hypothetical protein ANO14919_113520 [Xylariales sp. No.14919]